MHRRISYFFSVANYVKSNHNQPRSLSYLERDGWQQAMESYKNSQFIRSDLGAGYRLVTPISFPFFGVVGVLRTVLAYGK